MPESARHFLRSATAADHDVVDRAFSGYDLANRHSYVAFLLAQASAFLPVEDAIDRAEPTRVVPDWAERRRSGGLADDLGGLGVPLPAFERLPPFRSGEALLGAVYVLEGSRLGGQMLARSVPPDFPKSFLAAGNSMLWRSLLAMLEAELATSDQRQAAADAAHDVFALFEKGARVVASSR